MNVLWNNIADSLRAELAEYGSLLQLFEQQQAHLFGRDPDAVLRLSGEIEAQVARLHDCRARREQVSMEFAQAHGHPPGATLRSMLPSIASDARPLIEALINQELGEPFRRDAMKKPVEVAGISKADMRPQVAG